MKERVINLSGLVVEILLHWRSIIMLMVAGGLLLGAFSFIQSYRSIQNEVDEDDMTLEEMDEDSTLIEILNAWSGKDKDLEKNLQKWYDVDASDLHQIVVGHLEEELSELQINNVEYTLYYEDLYHDKMSYQEQSVLMQMDPDEIYKAELTFVVESDDLDYTYNIEKVYEDIARSSELYIKLAEVADIPVPYTYEIYSMVRSSSGLLNGCDTFKLSIIHSDKNICNALMEAVVEYINDKHIEIEQELPAHEIKLLDQTLGQVSDVNVVSLQRSTQGQLLELQATIENRKSSFTLEEWYYYNLVVFDILSGSAHVTEEDEASSEEVLTNSRTDSAPGLSFKYVVSGMLFIPLCYILIICMKYVLNSKLSSADQIQEIYDIPLLGVIPDNEKESKKKKFASIDHLILSMCQQRQRNLTMEEAINLVAATIKWTAQKEGIGTIYFVGYDLKKQMPELYARMSALFDKEEIVVETLDNVLYNVESIRKLREFPNVVLLEKIGVSNYTEIAQELELLKQQEIKILGGIVVA